MVVSQALPEPSHVRSRTRCLWRLWLHSSRDAWGAAARLTELAVWPSAETGSLRLLQSVRQHQQRGGFNSHCAPHSVATASQLGTCVAGNQPKSGGYGDRLGASPTRRTEVKYPSGGGTLNDVLGDVQSTPERVGPLTRGCFSVNTVNLFSLPCDFLNNVCFSLGYLIVRMLFHTYNRQNMLLGCLCYRHGLQSTVGC